MSKTNTIDLESAFHLAWEAVRPDRSVSTTPADVQDHALPASRPQVGWRPQRPRPIYQPRTVTIRQNSGGVPRLSFNSSTLHYVPSGPTSAAVSLPEQVHCSEQSHYADKYRSTATKSGMLLAKIVIDEGRSSISTYSLESSTDLEDCIATSKDLAKFTTAYPLPPAEESTRWTAWRYVSYYMRVWAVILLVNSITMVIMISYGVAKPGSFTYGSAAAAVGANLLASTLARHEHIINFLFRIVCFLPLSTPLWLRRRAAKVYSYGGIHSGCGISAMLWYLVYAVLATLQFDGTGGEEAALAITTTLTIILLIIITGMAHPAVRRCFHNQWELSHRFGGWFVVLLVWAQTTIIVVANAQNSPEPTREVLAKTPTFYFLLLTTLLILYPWLRLRRRKVTHSEQLSSHALRLHFNDRRVSHCIGYRLATNPLLETHGFATIPNPTPLTPSDKDEETGYSILISNAGDWTSHLITHPPKAIWTKGAPTVGLMRIASLFSPLVIVATGSGIGPALSFLQAKPHWPVRVIWSARAPLKTYGAEIVESVLRADGRAVVVDTDGTGRPDLVGLAWGVMREGLGGRKAEAVVVVANPTVTGVVVGGLERRGVPAFGAIFDS